MNPFLGVFRPLSTGALKHTLLAASLGLALFLPQAEAALFDFSYVYNGNTLQGIVEGTLQGDNNKVAVDSIPTLTFNGEARPSLPLVHNADHLYSVVLFPDLFPLQPGFPDETTPWLTLDGSYYEYRVLPVGGLRKWRQYQCGKQFDGAL